MVIDLHIKNNLIFDGEHVGYRVIFKGMEYDTSNEDIELIVEDFIRRVNTETKGRDIELVEKGNLLVPVGTNSAEELTYGKFVTLIGLDRLATTDLGLKKLYNKYNKEIFNNDLPKDVHLYWSSRMTTGAGVCNHKVVRGYYQTSIGLSVPYHDKYKDELVDTLVHEMIHVKYPRDKHGMYFKNEMSRINRDFGLNITIYSTGRATEKKYNYIYACTDCGQEFTRIKRHGNDYAYATCGVTGCSGRIYLKENLVDDYVEF